MLAVHSTASKLFVLFSPLVIGRLLNEFETLLFVVRIFYKIMQSLLKRSFEREKYLNNSLNSIDKVSLHTKINRRLLITIIESLINDSIIRRVWCRN
jgi:hypothetical protein